MKRKIIVRLLLIVSIIVYLRLTEFSVKRVYYLSSQTRVSPDQAPIDVVLSSSRCLRLGEGVFGRYGDSLGCPSTGHPRTPSEAWPIKSIYQPFENGMMIWIDGGSAPFVPSQTFVLNSNGGYESYSSSRGYVPGAVGRQNRPPRGLYKPDQQFRQIWQNQPDVRESLGWATGRVMTSDGLYQPFHQGQMIWLSVPRKVYIIGRSSYKARRSSTFNWRSKQPPADADTLIANLWGERREGHLESRILNFTTEGDLIFEECRGTYLLLIGSKIGINTDECLNSPLPSGIYEYALSHSGKILALSHRYQRTSLGYSESYWTQEDNSYDMELAPSGVKIIGETDCYGEIVPTTANLALISWDKCDGGEKWLPDAEYKFTYIGDELFLTRQFYLSND